MEREPLRQDLDVCIRPDFSLQLQGHGVRQGQAVSEQAHVAARGHECGQPLLGVQAGAAHGALEQAHLFERPYRQRPRDARSSRHLQHVDPERRQLAVQLLAAPRGVCRHPQDCGARRQQELRRRREQEEGQGRHRHARAAVRGVHLYHSRVGFGLCNAHHQADASFFARAHALNRRGDGCDPQSHLQVRLFSADGLAL